MKTLAPRKQRPLLRESGLPAIPFRISGVIKSKNLPGMDFLQGTMSRKRKIHLRFFRRGKQRVLSCIVECITEHSTGIVIELLSNEGKSPCVMWIDFKCRSRALLFF
ncbi:MAG: hypothetical protein V4576_04175 [Patescibacteria group bacterium]